MKTTEPSAGIDQVREILVGAVQRNMEQRLARAESQLASRITELQQEMRRRTEVLETHVRTETEALARRLDAELVELRDGMQRIAKLEDTSQRAQHDLRGQILEQAKSFLDELHRTREELTTTLNRELSSLELEPAELHSEPREQLEDQRH
jgi:hypothetical protein